jgi:hydroxypyruvate reductase
VALISGGECTVTIAPGGNGRGGRCSEFLLSLAIELAGLPQVYALAADTDGIDGSENNAGAWLAPDTVARAAARGVAARAALDAHDAWGFFAAAEALLHTGPTRTNVNDYRAILVL